MSRALILRQNVDTFLWMIRYIASVSLSPRPETLFCSPGGLLVDTEAVQTIVSHLSPHWTPVQTDNGKREDVSKTLKWNFPCELMRSQ